MARDDTPYWARAKIEDLEEPPKTAPGRRLNYPPAAEVLATSENRKRAPKPSPLLEEYMKAHGKEVI